MSHNIRSKTFITGGSGFVGNALFKKLHTHDVYLYSRGESLDCLTDFQPDFIIHCAGEIYDEEKMFESNIELTNNLLEASKNIPYQAFIYIGSSSEYGRKDHPMSEGDYLDPTNYYEATKGAGSLLSIAHAREFNKPVMIARPFSLYGEGEPSHRFIPTLLKSARKHERINLAPGVHDFIHIDDFVNGLIALMNHPKPGEVFNFGSGLQLGNSDVVEIVEAITNKPILRNLVNKMHEYDTTTWVADISKAKSLGWEPKISFQEGLKRLWHHS